MAAINPLHYVIGKTNTQLKAEADYVKESKNQWKDYDLKQSQVGFLKTAEGIKLVAEKTAELRKGSKFLNAEIEVGDKVLKQNTESLKKYNEEVEKSKKKSKDLADELMKIAGIQFGQETQKATDALGKKFESGTISAESESMGTGDNSKLPFMIGIKSMVDGQKKVEAETKKANSELETQMSNMQQMQSIMAGFGDAASTAFGEQSAAAKAFAVGQVIAQAAVGIMGTWAGYAKFGMVGTALAIAQTAMIGGLAMTQIGNIAGAFAMGGIVGGSSMSGDNLTARVNSGEMILNGNQQRELFAMANGMGARSQVEVVGYISGDVIRLANKRSTYVANRRG
jgi:hypothetical protein